MIKWLGRRPLALITHGESFLEKYKSHVDYYCALALLNHLFLPNARRTLKVQGTGPGSHSPPFVLLQIFDLS